MIISAKMTRELFIARVLRIPKFRTIGTVSVPTHTPTKEPENAPYTSLSNSRKERCFAYLYLRQSPPDRLGCR